MKLTNFVYSSKYEYGGQVKNAVKMLLFLVWIFVYQ